MATALDYNRLMFDEDDTEALAAEFRELEKHFGEEPEDGAGRVQAGEVVFATAENIGECVTYLNQSLQSFGIASKLRGLSADPQDYAAFCNAMYEMLQMRQRDMQDREQQADAIMRLESDKAVSITNVKKLTAQLDTKERDIGSLLIKERSAEAARKRQSEKLTADREEALRKCKAMQQRDTQFAHDLRKKDLEFSRLQARLHSLLTEKKKQERAGMDMIGALEAGKRGQWSGKDKDGDFMRMMISAYENKQKDLILENSGLRASMAGLQEELRDVMNSSLNTARPPPVSPAPPGGLSSSMDAPYDVFLGNVQESTRAKLEYIRGRLLALDTMPRTPSRGRGTVREAELEQEVNELRLLMGEQEQVIAALARGQAPQEPTTPAAAAAHAHEMATSPIATSPMEPSPAPPTPNEESEDARRAREEREAADEERRRALDEERRRIESERTELQRRSKAFLDEQAAFRTTLKMWAPGMGAGHFLSQAIKKTPGSKSLYEG
eukprot:CAMPEP_0182858710 /NCGR_PEP_ID=MMETSP0034_2-20130328/3836_1 /TAXON_ID=156128 /ORGANISM="Nephroselmis pyriformis, Strain CCMP717" /LENGTH=496 /DNA_ID=CAMNT_0024990171 /DNA_START=65 /DNA_END=1551 /DNA_ORIENTATION=-